MQESFKKSVNKYSDIENFVLTSLVTWHMGSTWCTPDLNVVAIDI